MKATSTRPYLSISWLLVIGFLPGLLLALVQWRFSQLTGSMLVGCQGVLQMILTVAIWAIALDQPTTGGETRRPWKVTLQLLNGLLVFLVCGYIVSESYVRWQEGMPVQSAYALPVIWLGVAGHCLLALVVSRQVSRAWSAFWEQRTLKVLALVSLATGMVMLVTHLTGWRWLDLLVGGGFASILGLLAVGFMLDAYWALIDAERAAR